MTELERVRIFFDSLMAAPHELTPREAFSVICYLPENMHIDLCISCEKLFHTKDMSYENNDTRLPGICPGCKSLVDCNDALESIVDLLQDPKKVARMIAEAEKDASLIEREWAKFKDERDFFPETPLPLPDKIDGLTEEQIDEHLNASIKAFSMLEKIEDSPLDYFQALSRL